MPQITNNGGYVVFISDLRRYVIEAHRQLELPGEDAEQVAEALLD